MTVAITGNTFPVKDQIKALGGKWDSIRKAWMVSDDKADQARAIVASTAKPAPTNRTYRPAPSINQPCRKCGTYCYGDCDCEAGGS